MGVDNVDAVFKCFLAELNDKVPRKHWGSVGDGNADIDDQAITRDGEPNLLMINKVRIGYVEYEGVKDIRWYFCIVLFHALLKILKLLN